MRSGHIAHSDGDDGNDDDDDKKRTFVPPLSPPLSLVLSRGYALALTT